MSVNKLMDAFLLAKRKGIDRPKIYLGDYLFKLAPVYGKNPGAIYITLNGTYLGKVLASGDVVLLPDYVDRKVEIDSLIADPEKAANAFGQRTGNCAICGRTLTAKESLIAHVGPICAERYGFWYPAPIKATLDEYYTAQDIAKDIPDDF